MKALRRPLFFSALALIAACSEETPPPRITEVVTEQVTVQPFKPTISFVGRLQAEDDVKIQAKVTGYLKEWHFREGDMIKKGDLLYEIDPKQYEADLSKAKAGLASAEAEVTVGNRNYARGKELLPKGAISASEMDRLEASKLQADADLEGAKAQLEAAEVDLSYTRITAPIDGRIGRSAFSPGDLIGPDSGTLTSLVSIDPMKALFQVSEAIYLARSAEVAKQEADGNVVPKLVVQLELTDKSIYPETGEVDYLANRIDENTGTIEVRAAFPNPKGLLRPGQYVRVIVAAPFDIDTIMLPQAAVQADQQGSYVFTVGPDNKVARKNIQVGQRVESNVVVEKGIEPGEKVIVAGVQKVRPGQVVKATSRAAGKAATTDTDTDKSEG